MDLFKIVVLDISFIIIMAGISFFAYKLYNVLPIAWFLPIGNQTYDLPLKSPRIGVKHESIIYVSLLTILGYLFYINNGISLLLACNVLTLIFLSFVFVSDAKTLIIPNQFTFVLIFISLFWILYDISIGVFVLEDILRIVWNRFFGGLLGGGILLLLNIVASKLLKQESIGMGDVKLLFACGLIVTSQGILWVITLAFFTAFPFALIKQFSGKRHEKISFGPFISLATIIFLLFPTFLLSISSWWFGGSL